MAAGGGAGCGAGAAAGGGGGAAGGLETGAGAAGFFCSSFFRFSSSVGGGAGGACAIKMPAGVAVAPATGNARVAAVRAVQARSSGRTDIIEAGLLSGKERGLGKEPMRF